MKHKDLPERWKEKVENYLRQQNPEVRELSADDFNFNLRITFNDGSNAYFKYSFYWIDEVNKEVAVFTEHCGYHIFNLLEILIETFDWEGNTVKIDDFRTE